MTVAVFPHQRGQAGGSSVKVHQVNQLVLKRELLLGLDRSSESASLQGDRKEIVIYFFIVGKHKNYLLINVLTHSKFYKTFLC